MAAPGSQAQMEVLEKQLMKAAEVVEQQLDTEIKRLDNLDEDDYERIRQKRLDDMKKMQKKKQEWQNAGHGQYHHIGSETEFFDATKKSHKVVCHFQRQGSERCNIFDHHLKILAQKHMETKFLFADAEKLKWLCERLHIRVIPTLLVVIDQKTKDQIVGFADLGNCDDFSTEMLEWRLGCAEAITYQGDLLHPPDEDKAACSSKKSIFSTAGSKKLKETKDAEDDEDDW